MQFLLDTNIVSALVRNPAGPVTERLREVGEQTVATSIIVAAELQYGAAKKGSKRLSAQLEAVLSALTVLPLEPPAELLYGELRATLERRGQLIGGNDMLIAAHAVSLDMTLVSDNEREFRRVDGLQLENWIR